MNYTIEEKIEDGSCGSVYKAKHKDSNVIVAIKTIRSSEKYFFNAELSILKMLSNIPNCIQLLDYDNKSLSMMFELWDTDLLNVMQDESFLDIPLERRKSLIRELLQGLYQLHKMKIIHGDIKPENILVTKNLDRVCIADFGHAFVRGTKKYCPQGTLAFCSPESMNQKNVSGREDMWAMGCLVYEILTAQQLFPDDSTMVYMSYFNKRRYETLPLISDATERDFIRGMLRIDPCRRMCAHEALRHAFFKN